MPNSVYVVPYNQLWPQMFEEEARLIKQALGSNCIEIYHIGSTAVPGLSAKPIIDMIPVVLNISEVDRRSKFMEEIGYEVKGEYGIPLRRYFQKGSIIRTHNVHIFEQGNPEIERHIYFRDWMRLHDDDRAAYAKLKISLSEKFPNDITSYCFGKDDFITNIDSKTGFDKLRVVRALTEREWTAVRSFRQYYFFSKVPNLDPYNWTFNHEDHIHVILYKGTTIVGYAHVQMWDDSRAVLRMIVVDESYRSEDIKSYFLCFIEKWLKSQNIEKLQIKSNQEAYNFYIQHRYIKMTYNDPDEQETGPQDIEIGKIL